MPPPGAKTLTSESNFQQELTCSATRFWQEQGCQISSSIPLSKRELHPAVNQHTSGMISCWRECGGKTNPWFSCEFKRHRGKNKHRQIIRTLTEHEEQMKCVCRETKLEAELSTACLLPNMINFLFFKTVQKLIIRILICVVCEKWEAGALSSEILHSAKQHLQIQNRVNVLNWCFPQKRAFT